jgi:hypothetical protein
VASSTVIPQMGSLVTDFDSFMVTLLSWLLLSLSFDSVFHPDMPINSQLFRVNRKFLFPFLNSLVIFWLQAEARLLFQV